MNEPLPGLRCVVAWSDRRNLCSIVGDELRSIVPEAELRGIGDDTYLVHTALSADELRNRLRRTLAKEEGLLVIDFERWSTYGEAVDARWLLARGH
ncbi:MAG TPA: hypothetical protein VIP09_10930 [Dehalococcoidia bacterium]|jgi:hypothetical protein